MKNYTRNINKWFPGRVTLLFPMTDLLIYSVLTVFCVTVIFTLEAEGHQNRDSHDEGKFNQIELPAIHKVNNVGIFVLLKFEKIKVRHSY